MQTSKLPQKFFPCFEEEATALGKQLLFCNSNTQNQADILMLHGGGIASSLNHYNVLRKDLFDFGVSSCAFDFIGHGQSKGILNESSLAQRTEEAYEVARSGRLKHPMTIVGASMGAYTALKLTELCQVDALILIVPAVYARQAYEASFKEEFTKIIRQPLSWSNSDAWEILERFIGYLTIIIAEKDEVIPKEIPFRLFDSARNARGRCFHTVPKSPHKILSYFQEATQEANADRILVAELIKKCHYHHF